MVLSTTPAGTISQTARGLLSALTNSASEAVPTAFSFTSSATALGDMSNTTHSWPPFSRRRTMLAPIRPRPIIPNCMVTFSFEEVDEFAIAAGDAGDRLLARRLPGFPVDKRIPEDGAADGKADEARHLARRFRATPAPSDRSRRGRARCSRHGRGRRPAPPPRPPRNPRGDRGLRSSRRQARHRRSAARGWPRPSGAAGPADRRPSCRP